MTEKDESKALEITDQTTTAVAPLGSAVLAQLTEKEFQTRVTLLKLGKARAHMVLKSLMTEGVDFGIIPGTDKKYLYQPGCEIMAAAYHLVAEMRPTSEPGDGVTGPPVRWLVECILHHGTIEGPVVAIGNGTANSWESKHRWRKRVRTCPSCGMAAITKGKPEYNRGAKRGGVGEPRSPSWLCNYGLDGCREQFAIDDEVITSQMVGLVENENQMDQSNTCLKMAEIRAFRGSIKRATATSGIFVEPTPELEVEPGVPGADGAPEGPVDIADLECPAGKTTKGKRAGDLTTGELLSIFERWQNHRFETYRSFAVVCGELFSKRDNHEDVLAEKAVLVESLLEWQTQDPEALGQALGAAGLKPNEKVQDLDFGRLKAISGERSKGEREPGDEG